MILADRMLTWMIVRIRDWIKLCQPTLSRCKGSISGTFLLWGTHSFSVIRLAILPTPYLTSIYTLTVNNKIGDSRDMTVRVPHWWHWLQRLRDMGNLPSYSLFLQPCIDLVLYCGLISLGILVMWFVNWVALISWSLHSLGPWIWNNWV